MTSGQETERVYSDNPGARMGPQTPRQSHHGIGATVLSSRRRQSLSNKEYNNNTASPPDKILCSGMVDSNNNNNNKHALRFMGPILNTS